MPLPIIPAVLAVGRAIVPAIGRMVAGTAAKGAAGQTAKTVATGVAKTGTGAATKAVNATSAASMLPTGGGKVDESWVEAAKKAAGNWQGWSQ
jgi:hypothetical protein